MVWGLAKVVRVVRVMVWTVPRWVVALLCGVVWVVVGLIRLGRRAVLCWQ
jgi:MFS superfamily sulfate permease-like transporter